MGDCSTGAIATNYMRVLIFSLSLMFSNAYAGEPINSRLSAPDLDRLCLTKLKIMDFAVSFRKVVPLDEMLDYWNKQFYILNVNNPKIFTLEADLEGQRIIRDVYRLGSKLDESATIKRYVHDEITWCANYQY